MCVRARACACVHMCAEKRIIKNSGTGAGLAKMANLPRRAFQGAALTWPDAANSAFSLTLLLLLVGDVTSKHGIIMQMDEATIFNCELYQARIRGSQSVIYWQCCCPFSISRQ